VLDVFDALDWVCGWLCWHADAAAVITISMAQPCSAAGVAGGLCRRRVCAGMRPCLELHKVLPQLVHISSPSCTQPCKREMRSMGIMGLVHRLSQQPEGVVCWARWLVSLLLQRLHAACCCSSVCTPTCAADAQGGQGAQAAAPVCF
jgi:hypothetical protein